MIFTKFLLGHPVLLDLAPEILDVGNISGTLTYSYIIMSKSCLLHFETYGRNTYLGQIIFNEIFATIPTSRPNTFPIYPRQMEMQTWHIRGTFNNFMQPLFIFMVNAFHSLLRYHFEIWTFVSWTMHKSSVLHTWLRNRISTNIVVLRHWL